MDLSLQVVRINPRLEGLLPVADINNRGLMDKGSISSILTKGTGVQQQLTIIKATESNSYYGAIVAVYKGGIDDLYAITTSGNTVNIKKLSANDKANDYDFYLKSSRDLIIKSSPTTATFRVRLLLLDYSNIDLDGCMKDNSDTDLTKINIQ